MAFRKKFSLNAPGETESARPLPSIGLGVSKRYGNFRKNKLGRGIYTNTNPL